MLIFAKFDFQRTESHLFRKESCVPSRCDKKIKFCCIISLKKECGPTSLAHKSRALMFIYLFFSIIAIYIKKRLLMPEVIMSNDSTITG